MFEARENHSIALYQNEIVFAVGGVCNGKVLRSCEGLLIEQKDWKQYSCMTVARESPGLCIIGNYLYAFGGLSAQGTLLNSIERLNLEFDMWSYTKMTLPLPL